MKHERIFADTNLFLRYLTNDGPEQADAVDQLLRRAAAGEIALITNSPGHGGNCVDAGKLLRAAKERYQRQGAGHLEHFRTRGRDLTLQAMAFYVDRNVDFIDAYNVAWMESIGLKIACTFAQKHFSRFDGVTIMVPGANPPEQKTG